VLYNGENVLEGKYNCLSKSQADVGLDTIHVEILNGKIPIGADYVHKHVNGSSSVYNAPTTVRRFKIKISPCKEPNYIV